MHGVPAIVPDLVSAVAMIGLAAWLVVLNPRHRANQFLALLLLVRGVSNLGLSRFPHDAALTQGLYSLDAAVELVLPFLPFMFALVYPKRRPLAARWWSWGILFLGIVVAESAYLVDPGSYGKVTLNPDGSYGGDDDGPLGLLALAQQISYAFLALVFARDFRKSPDPTLRQGLLLVSAGFGLLAGYLLPLVVLANLRAESVPALGAWALAILSVAFVLALWAVWVVWRHRSKTFDAERHAIRIATGTFAVAALSGVLSGLWNPALFANLRLTGLLVGLWKLAIPLLVSYALVRGQLPDIDLRVKWTIRQSTMAAILVAVFFVSAQLAQNFFSTEYGWAWGGAAAGLMLFAIAPLQRVAERVANAAMPGVQDSDQWRSHRKAEVYRTAIRYALADRRLERHEELHLAELATELGFDPAQALQMRMEIEQELGMTPKAPPAPALRKGKGR